MGIIQRIKSLFVEEVPDIPTEHRSLNNPNVPLGTALAGLSSPSGSAGAVVTVDTVLGLSEVWRAVKVLGETVASVPFRVIEKLPDGSTKDLPDHPVSIIFTIEPNRHTTAFTFIETMMLHALLRGNAYAWIEYNRRNAYPKAIHLIDPQEMQVFDDGDMLYYKHTRTNKTYTYDEILHLCNTSWNGKAGLDVISVHKENLSLALANRNYGANFYRNGAQLSGILKHPGSLSKEAMSRLKSSWRNAYEGSQNAGRTAILEEGMDYMPITLKPSDASFTETKRIVVADIARILGVPQFLLEDLDRATFNNIEHLSQLFLTLTVRPWCKRIEAEINRKLFPKSERGRIVAFLDFDDLLMADLKSRGEYARTLFNVGALSPNDIRKMSGYNPIEHGDKHYVQTNMADISSPVFEQPQNEPNTDNVQTMLSDAEDDQ